MALPEASPGTYVPQLDVGSLHTNWASLATNLQNQQTFGHTSRRNLNASAESAFAQRLEDYADRVYKLNHTLLYSDVHFLHLFAEI